MMDRTASFYAQPSYGGAAFPIFSGSRRQRGVGIFGALGRIAVPFAKSIGKSLLKSGVREAASLMTGVADDAIHGKNIGQSIKTRGMSHLKNFGKDALRAGRRGVLNTFVSQPLRKRKKSTVKKRKAPPKKKPRKANF